MSFENPAGLLLLLLLPLLILIYIIRSRYEDTPFSSTYIWKLSDRFLKKTLPIQRFRRILLFILQFLLITLFALAAAKPMIAHGESKDYVVILDCSAGMQVKDDKGQTRFEKAVKQTEKLADTLKNGHTLTVILAGQKASYLVKNTNSPALVKTALEKAACRFGECNIKEALTLAGEACAGVKAPKVLFLTYKEYENATGVTVKNLSLEEWNLSFLDLHAAKTKTGTNFTARLASYNLDTTATVGLRINGKTVDARTVKLVKDEPADVLFECGGVSAFDTAEVFVTAEDGMKEDNFFALCPNNDRCRILLFSNRPLYLQKAFAALGNCSVMHSNQIEGQPLEGFDLYVFDGIYPENYPTDGGVLLFGSEKLPDGLASGAPVSLEGRLSAAIDLDHPLFEGVRPKGCYVKEYTPLLGTSKWIFPLICDGKGVFALKNEEGSPLFAVCSFDLHHSNLPLQADFLILMRNLVTECLPSLVKDRDYTAEESITLCPPAGTEQLYLEHPDGSFLTLTFSDGYSNLTPSLPGIYTAAALQGTHGLYADFFVHIPEKAFEKESGEELLLPLPSMEDPNPTPAKRSVLFWAALLILVLILTEWGLYYHEQY